jgi:cytidylate kinase
VKETIMRRDKQDRERTIAPLTVAQDAIIVDSTNKTVSEVVDFMLQAIEQLYRP